MTVRLPDGEEKVFKGKRAFNKWAKDNADNADDAMYEYKEERIIEDVSHALQNVKSIISTIFEGIGTPRDYRIFLTEAGGETFRDKIATIAKYKGNRDDAPRPVHYDKVREYLVRYYDAEVQSGIEADDALAMNQEFDSVICSVDKDFCTDCTCSEGICRASGKNNHFLS